MKKIIKFIVLILTISTCFVFAAFGCGEDEGGETGVVLNATEVNLDIEKTFSLKASFSEKEFPVFEWSVDNPSVVSVSDRGLVTALRVGTATVSATCDGKSASCEVNVGLGDYVPAINLGALETVDKISVAAGTPFNFNPYIVYAGKIYNDATFKYSIDNGAYGAFYGNTFNASYTTGKVNVTVVADWRGADSAFLTKTFEVTVVDNVAISINEGSFSGDVNLYTVSEFKGVQYQTTQEFRVAVNENGVNIPLNVNNLSVVVADKNIATFSYATNVITAKNFGSTTVKISYTSNAGDTYDTVYNINVIRPVYRVEDKIIAFSVAQDKLDIAYYAGAGAKVVEAYQNGAKLTIKNNVVSGYTAVANKANESIFLFYTEDQVGYQVIADVYGYVIRTASDLNNVKDYNLTSVALANDIDASDAPAFATITDLQGSINGLGHTIYNLKLPASGITGAMTGGIIRDIAFVNLIPTAPSSTKQTYLCSKNSNTGSGTIENVYLTTDMGVADRGYTNSAIFMFYMSGLNIRNVVVEFPSMPMTEETNFGYKARYGLFMHNTSSETAASVEAPRYAGLYVISKAVDGNPAPLVTDEKAMTYSSDAYKYNNGAFGYMTFASNDYTDILTQTSDRGYVQTTYKQIEEIDNEKLGTTAGIVDQTAIINTYYMYPQYTLALNAKGEVVFTKLNQEIIQVKGQTVKNEALIDFSTNSGNWQATSGTAATADLIKVLGENGGKRIFASSGSYWNLISAKTSDHANPDSGVISGVGITRFGKGVVRLDDYSNFITGKYAVGSFGSAWDVSTGYPQWKGTAEYAVEVTANGNPVSKIDLVYDKVDLSRVSAVLGVTHATESLTNVSYEVIVGDGIITLEGATVTAVGAGVAFVGINFTMAGKDYTKYVLINATMAPGEYEYADKLAFSAGNGKLYKVTTDGEFNEVELSDIFGMETELTAAYMDGRKIALSADKQYAIGASIESKEILRDKELQLVAKNTAYNITVDVYGLVLKTEEDLKVLNIPTTAIKLQGYYVLANDIHCTTIGPINQHFDYYANLANTQSGDKSKSDFGFHGVFDGLGHTISGLYSGLCHSKTSGFFGFMGDGVTVKNVAFTDIKLTPPTNSMDVAYFFGYRCPNASVFENIYIEYSSDFGNLPYSMSVGLFQGIHNTARLKNVIIKTPTDPKFINGSTFGWNIFGGFADDNPDSFIENYDNTKDGKITASDAPRSHIFDNVYVIAAPASNGKISPISSTNISGPTQDREANYQIYAANDYVNLPELQGWDREIRTEGENNDKVAYAKNLVRFDINNPGTALVAYNNGDTAEWSQRNATLAIRRVKTVYRYDNFAGLYNALQAKATPTDQVGNWKISASGIVWNEVNA